MCKTPKQKEMEKIALEQKAQKLKKLLETVRKEERKLTQKEEKELKDLKKSIRRKTDRTGGGAKGSTGRL